jgi:uncharacterized protein YegL
MSISSVTRRTGCQKRDADAGEIAAPVTGRSDHRRNVGIALLLFGACVGLWMCAPTAATAATGTNHGYPSNHDNQLAFSRDDAWSRPRFSDGADSAPAVWQFMSRSGGWKPYDEVSAAAIKAAHAKGDAEVTVVPAHGHGRYRIVFAENAQYALDQGGFKRDIRLSSANTHWVDPKKPVADGKAVVAMLVDRSGSMAHLTDKVVDGSNEFIDKQREYDEKAGATTDLLFSTFDNAYDRLHTGAQLASVGKVTHSDIGARGSTALHDGIGQILQDTLQYVDGLQEAPAKVTVFIMTDGHENSSRQWSSDEIKQAVTSLKEQHKWQFIFAGANMDAVVAGSHYGFERSESVTYAARGRNVEKMMDSVSQSVNRYKSVPAMASRETLEAATAFTDEERAGSWE